MKVFITTLTLLCTSMSLFADRTIPATPEELSERAERAFANADEEIEVIIAIPDDKRTFENTLGALDDMMARLDDAANVAVFMQYVHPDASIRDAAQDVGQLWSDWAIDFETNLDLYNAVKAFADTNPELIGEQARMLAHTMRDYRRSGMALSVEDRETLT